MRRVSPEGLLVVGSEGSQTVYTGANGCNCTARCQFLSHECREVTLDGERYVLTEQSTFTPSPFGSEGVLLDGVTARPDLLYSYKMMLWDMKGDGPEHWRELVDLSTDLTTFPRHMRSFAMGQSSGTVEMAHCDAPSGEGGDDSAGGGSPATRGRRLQPPSAGDDAPPMDDALAPMMDDLPPSDDFMDDVPPMDDLPPMDDMPPMDDPSMAATDDAIVVMRWLNEYHVSSADIVDGLIVLSLRNVNAIVALYLDGSGVAWTIASPGAMASDLPSTLTLGGAAQAAKASAGSPQKDAFYQVGTSIPIRMTLRPFGYTFDQITLH